MYSSLDNPGWVRVLTFLHAHNTEYLSGQDLSDVLKISRVAVWKHIKKIQESGYTVESRQRQGYRLTASPNVLYPWEVTSGLKTMIIGRKVYYFDVVDSTQDQALKMADNPANNGAVIIAARQTHGRGRNGRKWISPKGGIWLSVILQPEFDMSVTTLFPVAASLALSNALEGTLDVHPELKWPNDLTVGGKKVAGILVNASMASNRIESIVLGVGINFDVDARHIEDSLVGSPNFYGAASLGQKKVRSVQLVQAFLTQLEKIYNMLDAGQTDKIISEWTERSSTIGSSVEIKTVGSITARGKAVRIDADGALVLDDGSRTLAGDVIHLQK